MGRVEVADRRRPGALQCREGGPLLEEATGHRTGQIVAGPAQRLGKILFQRGLQLQQELSAQVDGGAPLLNEAGEEPGRGVVGAPWTELIAMPHEEREQQPSIRGIVLRSIGRKGLAKATQAPRIHGIEDDERGVKQGLNERSARGFQGNAHGLSTEANGERGEPRRQDFGRVWQPRFLDRRGRGRLQRDIVVVVGPIDPDTGSEEFWMSVRHEHS